MQYVIYCIYLCNMVFVDWFNQLVSIIYFFRWKIIFLPKFCYEYIVDSHSCFRQSWKKTLKCSPIQTFWWCHTRSWSIFIQSYIINCFTLFLGIHTYKDGNFFSPQKSGKVRIKFSCFNKSVINNIYFLWPSFIML